MSNFVLPGDKIAITEEYEPGKNACDDGHIVRSTVIGENQIDKKDQKMLVLPPIPKMLLSQKV